MTSDILERLGELVERWGVLHITGRGCKPDRAFGGGLIGFDRAASLQMCTRRGAPRAAPGDFLGVSVVHLRHVRPTP